MRRTIRQVLFLSPARRVWSVAVLASVIAMPGSAAAADYVVDYPRHLDARHVHAKGGPKYDHLTLRRNGATLKQALLEADGRLRPLPPIGVAYDDVFPNVSIAYEPRNGLLKETILLRSPDARSAFSFWVQGTKDGKHLKARLEPDKTVTFRDPSGRTVFAFAPPFMYDSAGAVSRSVEFTVERARHHGEKGYRILLQADRAWLRERSRAFPVAVDPTVLFGEVCLKLDFTGGCTIYHDPVYGPDVPGYENLSLPQLTDEMVECAMDLSPPGPPEPGVHCDAEGLVPDVDVTDVQVITPIEGRSGRARAAQAYAVCGMGVSRPRRSPGPGRSGPYFVKGKGKAVCLGNAVKSVSVSACVIRDDNGRADGGEVPLSCRSAGLKGPGTVTVNPEWCCTSGRHFYKTSGFATGTVTNGKTIPSDFESAYTLKKIRC